ncbi:MAG: hypothetical protein A2176_05555 [Spirochaetes bacterium RBG_13_51_14]|nr:MAG: hypothetical protein A2176_05555 [Spirochaetes bacterium RBG_13_51_14]
MRIDDRLQSLISVLFLFLLSSCSKELIRSPVTASEYRWDLTLSKLTLGPDQYNTADGYWRPREGKKFLWATVIIHNSLKTDQQFYLDRINVASGKKLLKPFIIDMDSIVAIKANPAPILKPGETVSRKLIYILPRGVLPEKLVYENVDINIPLRNDR